MTYTKTLNVELNKQGADGKNAITMTSATTPNGEYNGQIGIWQGQLYQWDGTSWVLTSGILPTDPVLHYSFDDLPDLPDGTSKLYLTNGKTYETMKSWSKNYNYPNATPPTITNNNGNIVVTTSEEFQGIYKFYTIQNYDFLKIKVKVKQGFLEVIGIEGLEEQKRGVSSGEYIFRGDGSGRAVVIYGSQNCIFEVESIFIGEARYTIPVIDNSGNNNNGTLRRAIVDKGINGKGIKFVGQNEQFCIINNVLKQKNTNFSFSVWIKGNLKSNYGVIGTRTDSYSKGWGLYNRSVYYITSNAEYFCYLPDINYEDNYHHIVGVYSGTSIIAYLDGVKVNTKVITLFSGEQSVDNIYLGRMWDAYLADYSGNIDDFQIFDRALSDQEVLGLYLAHGNTPKQFTLNDYRLNLIDDDGVISVSEKKELLRRWKEIYNAENVSSALPTSNITANGEYMAVIDAANLLNIGSISAITTYREATNSLRDAFWNSSNGYLNNMTTASTLNGNLDSLFANYKQALQNANNAISDQQSAQASAITVQMASPFVQLPVNDSGSVTSYDNSGNVITVLNGAVTLTPVTSTATLSDNQYSVTASGSGITAGSVSVDTTNKKVTIGNSTAMTKSNAQITYTIKFKINGTTGTLYAQQKISTASRGADGKRGPMYRGTTKPTTDVVYGDWYLDTTDNLVHVYNNSNWNTTITNYDDYRYTPALNDMLAIAAEKPDVGFIKIATAHIQKLAAGNILANVLTTKELKLTGYGVIKSENYGETTGGFEIKANGQATFVNVETPIISDEGNVCFLRCMTSALVKPSSFTETDFITVYPACIGYVRLEVYLQSFRGQSFSGTLNIGGTSINVSNKKSYVYTKTEYYSSRNSFTNIIFTPTATSTTSDDYIVMVVSLGSNIQKQSWVYKKLVTESEVTVSSNDITWHLNFTEKIAKATGKIAVEKSFDGGKDGDKSVPQPILQNAGGNVTGGNIYRFFSTTPFSQGHGAISGLYHTSNQTTEALANTVRTHVYWANKNQSASVIINSVAVSLEAEWWNADLGNRSTT